MVKIAVVVALYLVMGELLFLFVVTLFGGKEVFKIGLGDTDKEADLAYLLCNLSVVVLWPVFLIGGAFNKKKEDE